MKRRALIQVGLAGLTAATSGQLFAQASSESKKGSSSPGPSDPLKALRRKYDKMTAMAWYEHPTTPSYRNQSGVFLMFGRGDDGRLTHLRFVMQYAAEDWLFIRRAWARADGVRVELPQMTSRLGWERDNGSSGIWEWSDAAIETKGEATAIKALAAAKEVTVRFEGRQYYKDRQLSASQLRAMREVIAAYEAVQGRPLP